MKLLHLSYVRRNLAPLGTPPPRDLKGGCNPITRLVGPDAHFTFQSVRYSVSQEYVGLPIQVRCDPNSGKILVFSGQSLIESHDFVFDGTGRVTKPEHLLYPQDRKVRVDGHVLFHGKLYSTVIFPAKNGHERYPSGGVAFVIVKPQVFSMTISLRKLLAKS